MSLGPVYYDVTGLFVSGRQKRKAKNGGIKITTKEGRK
jgi:hypothetical protein